MYGTGISREDDSRFGARPWTSSKRAAPGIRIRANGWARARKNVKVFLKEHGDIADEIEQIIRDTLAAEPEKFEDVMEEPMQADDLPDTLAETDGE